MECSSVRESLSARLDGEATHAPTADVDSHLGACDACRTWLARAEQVSRAVRVAPAERVPDLTAAIVAARPAAPQRTVRAPSPLAWRLLLGAIAVAHVAVALPGLIDAGSAAGAAHLATELGAFDAALAAGLLLAAWQPERAAGMAPVIAIAVVGLVATSIVSLAAGRTDAIGESPHLLDALGIVALVAVARTQPATSVRGRRRWTPTTT